MQISKLNNFDINCHLSLPPCELAQIANSCSWWTFTFCVGVHIGYEAKEDLHIGKLELTHMFAILNAYFNVVKQENKKSCIGFF